MQHIKAFHIGQSRLLILSRGKDIYETGSFGHPRLLIHSCGKDIDEAKSLKVRSISLDLCTPSTTQFSNEPQVSAITALSFGNILDVDHDLSSCNGLVLLTFGKHIILWNPLMRRSTKVLELRGLDMFTWTELGGLCYDPFSNDYKVVLLLSHEPIHIIGGDQYVIVSGLKNKGWRKLPFPYKYDTTRVGVNFNNTLHWIVRDRITSPSFRPVHVDMVLYFDVVDNAFKQLPTPTQTNLEEENSIAGTGIIEGCFCIGQRNQERKAIQVSVMKEYGNPESWVTIFAIPILEFRLQFSFYNLNFFSLDKSKTLTIMCNGCRTVYVYDVEEDKVEEWFPIPEDNYGGGMVRMCFYAQSFELPYGVSWGDGDREKCRIFL
ncbi:unnamed protein product [Cuscuta epithymum]|uniref:F-box associated beta-propeller type 1 domain-containing protein n=1 Tax=Cuscuta epithymum TaxID=186058 RepID=A0AAV0GJJ6_9ASTE|nr:unnamed protein product [Cuscuta epithymum]